MSAVDDRAVVVSKPRILACLLCQQRKVKCNRIFPCQICLKAGLQCVPASTIPSKPRRRRFAERELLDRIRRYERLMREHGIDFDSLHPGITKPSPATRTPALPTEAIDLWQALSRATLDSDESEGDQDYDASTTADADIINESYTQRFKGNGFDHTQDHLLFGPILIDTLVHFHPDPSNIFRLWQVYLENINPLLKITHTPDLQPRIIEAMGKLEHLEPSFELLLFSIYSVATISLDEEQCQRMFQTSRDDMLLRFQTACQQALHKCAIWKSASDEALAAFFLFLISLRGQADVRSLSCMLAVLLRMAQRNGLHIEATSAKHTTLEAELRRRLWWSLVQYDSRICELCNHTSSMMTPAWDCALPLNLNDFELRSEVKVMPNLTHRPTEATFVVLRARLADFMRHSTPHLSFTNPRLSSLAKKQYDGSIDALEKEQETIFRSCDLADTLHHMTVWTLRGSIAKLRLLEHYAIFNTTSKPSNAERSTAMLSAMKMLVCDTKVRQASLTKGFIWYATFNFPALAYHHILNTMCKRPGGVSWDQGWQAMENNYETFSAEMAAPGIKRGLAHFFVYTAKLFLEAWRVREAYLIQRGNHIEIISPMLLSMQSIAQSSNEPMPATGALSPEDDLSSGDLSTPAIAGILAESADFDFDAHFLNTAWNWTDGTMESERDDTVVIWE